MFNKKTIEDMNLKGKRVLVRVDYNVPLDEKMNVTDNTRIKLSLPTINYLIGQGAKVILMSHLGRPKDAAEEKYRLTPAAKELEKLTGKKVIKFDETFSEDIKSFIDNEMQPGSIAMLENLLDLTLGRKKMIRLLRKSLRHLQMYMLMMPSVLLIVPMHQFQALHSFYPPCQGFF